MVLVGIGKGEVQEVLEGWGRTQGGAKRYTMEGCACVLGCVRLSATPKTAARQIPLPMKILQQEYWSRRHALLHVWQEGSLPLAPPGKRINCTRGELNGR